MKLISQSIDIELCILSFSVQFRTTPLNSTGVPHILEHVVLCGSEKYQIRDPFFKMLTRSLSTFMNAFTGQYWFCMCVIDISVKDSLRLTLARVELMEWITHQHQKKVELSFYFLDLCSKWLHNVSIFHPKLQGFSESSLCLPWCCLLSLPKRIGLLVRCKLVQYAFYICLYMFCILVLTLFIFRQEGWRLEHDTPSDQSSPLVFKGVVFNEMKGVFVSLHKL